MTNAMKKHVANYKSEYMRVRRESEMLEKKAKARCTEVWDLSAQITFGKTLAELEAIVKEQDNAQ
jgi:hypothetical protein